MPLGCRVPDEMASGQWRAFDQGRIGYDFREALGGGRGPRRAWKSGRSPLIAPFSGRTHTVSSTSKHSIDWPSSRRHALTTVAAAVGLAPTVVRAQALATIRVGGPPAEQALPLFYANRAGLFERAGIKLELSGGAAGRRPPQRWPPAGWTSASRACSRSSSGTPTTFRSRSSRHPGYLYPERRRVDRHERLTLTRRQGLQRQDDRRSCRQRHQLPRLVDVDGQERWRFVDGQGRRDPAGGPARSVGARPGRRDHRLQSGLYGRDGDRQDAIHRQYLEFDGAAPAAGLLVLDVRLGPAKPDVSPNASGRSSPRRRPTATLTSRKPSTTSSRSRISIAIWCCR